MGKLLPVAQAFLPAAAALSAPGQTRMSASLPSGATGFTATLSVFFVYSLI